MQSTAQAKKARRATRNKARRNGDPMQLLQDAYGRVEGKVFNGDNLLAAQRRAELKFNKIAKLTLEIAEGGLKAVQARKALKKMQEQWFDRDTKPNDWHAPDGAKTAVGKEKMRRGPQTPRI